MNKREGYVCIDEGKEKSKGDKEMREEKVEERRIILWKKL